MAGQEIWASFLMSYTESVTLLVEGQGKMATGLNTSLTQLAAAAAGENEDI